MGEDATIDRQLEFADEIGFGNDGGHGAVRKPEVFDSLDSQHGFEQALQRGNVRSETRPVLIEEEFFGDHEGELRALRGLSSDIVNDLLKRETLSGSQGNRAELTTPAASASDFDRSVGRAVPQARDAFHTGTVSLHFAWDRLAARCGFEQLHHFFFGLAIKEAVNEPLVLQPFLFDLPRAWATDNDFQMRLVSAKQWMEDQPAKRLGVDGLDVRTIEIGVYICRKGDA